jgi:hypothetical protein
MASPAASGCQSACEITHVIVDHIGMQDEFVEPVVFSTVPVDTTYIQSCLTKRKGVRLPFEAHVISCEHLTKVGRLLQIHSDDQQGITGDYGNFRIRIYSGRDTTPKLLYVSKLIIAVDYFERVCSDLQVAKLDVEADVLKAYLLKFR